jgi:cysteinyl-tRNA synthetase
MAIRLYNTLTNQVEPFEPVEPGKVLMYACGPTVYDFAHIGNFRTFLFGDVLRRFLEVSGYEVRHVMNITDVGHMTDDDVADGGGEDKMEVAQQRIKEAKKAGKVKAGEVANPDDPYQIARYYEQAFIDDGRRLGLKVASEDGALPRATEHIRDMQAMISDLIERGHAYATDDGVVYYSVESFDEYGRLSGNTLDKLRAGSGGRVLDEHQQQKRHPGDFMLWKADESHLMKWDSPWGTGYPGWHIECSAMARQMLGRDVIDIHTGGEDLIFPHHECEIAQTCGATGEASFARFWMHARFLLVDGEKMSKSSGTFYTVRDVLGGKVTGNPVHPAVLRFELIKSHYRSNQNFTAQSLKDSAGSVRRLQSLHEKLMDQTGGEAMDVGDDHPVVAEFLRALGDDLNISGALGVVLPWAAKPGDDPKDALGVLRKLDHVLGVTELADVESDAGGAAAGGSGFDADELCRRLDDARKAKDFETADNLRKQLVEAGYDVQTTPDGTKATRKLA